MKICIISFLIIAISIVLTSFIDPIILSILLEKFIFNTVSILVGLSVAIVGIFLSSINSLYLSIYKIIKVKDSQVFSNDDIDLIKRSLDGIVEELKQNVLFTLIVYLVILLFFFIKDLDLPHIKWFVESDLVTKGFVINNIILIGNFSIFWAIIDSILVVFKITNAFQLMKNNLSS